VLMLCFFFFQAEDGIRDWSVTGVQTCALPISAFICVYLWPFRGFLMDKVTVAEARRVESIGKHVVLSGWVRTRRDSKGGFSFLRSEERRVGKRGDLGGWRIIRNEGRTDDRRR